MIGFRDIHAHFVYGVDDGARTREEMFAMLDAAHRDGVTDLCATPHVTPGVKPFDGLSFSRHFDLAQEYCRENDYPLELHAGAEILYTPALARYAEEGMLPTLGTTDFALMEFVPDVSLAEAESAVELMERAGYRLVLAHIERYRCMFHGNAQRIKRNHHVYFQVNCQTVIEKKRFLKAREINGWFEDGLIDYVATDQHNCTSRRTRMREAYQILREEYGTRYANRLVGLNRRKREARRIG